MHQPTRDHDCGGDEQDDQRGEYILASSSKAEFAEGAD
jgi:hypothetical protein